VKSELEPAKCEANKIRLLYNISL